MFYRAKLLLKVGICKNILLHHENTPLLLSASGIIALAYNNILTNRICKPYNAHIKSQRQSLVINSIYISTKIIFTFFTKIFGHIRNLQYLCTRK